MHKFNTIGFLGGVKLTTSFLCRHGMHELPLKARTFPLIGFKRPKLGFRNKQQYVLARICISIFLCMLHASNKLVATIHDGAKSHSQRDTASRGCKTVLIHVSLLAAHLLLVNVRHSKWASMRDDTQPAHVYKPVRVHERNHSLILLVPNLRRTVGHAIAQYGPGNHPLGCLSVLHSLPYKLNILHIQTDSFRFVKIWYLDLVSMNCYKTSPQNILKEHRN
jgi:hypothetical protein